MGKKQRRLQLVTAWSEEGIPEDAKGEKESAATRVTEMAPRENSSQKKRDRNRFGGVDLVAIQ